MKLFRKFFFLFFTIFLINGAVAQQKNSFKILDIRVEGNETVDARTVIAQTGLRIDEEIQIPGDRTINAINRLWELNLFSDVQLLIDKQVDNGIFLLIVVVEHPRLEKFVISGNDGISTSDIEDIVNKISRPILRPQDVSKIRRSLISKYAEEGYNNVTIQIDTFSFYDADSLKKEFKVTWRNQRDLSDFYIENYDVDDRGNRNLISKLETRKLLKIDISEGERSVVRKISFVGNTHFSNDDLESVMDEISVKKWWKFWSSARFYPDKLKKDKDLIVKFYQENGFRDADVISDSLHYYNSQKDVDVYLFVYEGPQYKIRSINWLGNTVYPAEFLTERLGFLPGDVYNGVAFQQNLRGNEKQSDVASLYLDNGYLTLDMKVNERRVEGDSLDITITVTENNQFKIGTVSIAGNDKTKDKVIRRELYTVPGDFFNKALLFRSLQQLANLQFFNVEKLYSEGLDYNLENDSTVSVSFKVEEKSSDYLNASVGYSGSFGFSGAVGITLTNFSITEPFSLGGGQILSFNWQFGVGNFYRTFQLGFTEPWFMDTPTLVGLDLYSTRQRYIYDLSQFGTSIKVGRRLKWPDDYFYVQGFFRYQNNDVIDGGSFYREGQTNQYTLGATISRKDVDNPIFPSRGSSLMLNAEISGGPFLPGDVDYFKLGIITEWYKRLFNSNRVALYLQSDFGYIEELVKGTSIQPFELFYMGGSGLVIATTPLRGYDDRTVGPRQANGEVIGGRVNIKYTAELRLAVALDPIPLYILAFAEAGNVFESLNVTDPFDLRRAAGVGARILINPIGLIGFDLGYGFDREKVDGTEPKWQFHFQFGRGF
ncbi:MAG: outer membrane protein assembly factor BamA [Ignavibacteriaceae bacterium]|nr:outer membrane protein assembly factor BamA [Ignavibacteriaceae bacterium]